MHTVHDQLVKFEGQYYGGVLIHHNKPPIKVGWLYYEYDGVELIEEGHIADIKKIERKDDCFRVIMCETKRITLDKFELEECKNDLDGWDYFLKSSYQKKIWGAGTLRTVTLPANLSADRMGFFDHYIDKPYLEWRESRPTRLWFAFEGHTIVLKRI